MSPGLLAVALWLAAAGGLRAAEVVECRNAAGEIRHTNLDCRADETRVVLFPERGGAASVGTPPETAAPGAEPPPAQDAPESPHFEAPPGGSSESERPEPPRQGREPRDGSGPIRRLLTYFTLGFLALLALGAFLSVATLWLSAKLAGLGGVLWHAVAATIALWIANFLIYTILGAIPLIGLLLALVAGIVCSVAILRAIYSSGWWRAIAAYVLYVVMNLAAAALISVAVGGAIWTAISVSDIPELLDGLLKQGQR